MIAFAKSRPEGWSYPVAAVLEQGGAALTLKLLEAVPKYQPPFKADQYGNITGTIRMRIGIPVKSDRAGSEEEKRPTEKELADMRKVMANNPTEERFYNLFGVMTRYDPAPVADYLVGWVGEEDRRYKEATL